MHATCPGICCMQVVKIAKSISYCCEDFPLIFHTRGPFMSSVVGMHVRILKVTIYQMHIGHGCTCAYLKSNAVLLCSTMFVGTSRPGKVVKEYGCGSWAEFRAFSRIWEFVACFGMESETESVNFNIQFIASTNCSPLPYFQKAFSKFRLQVNCWDVHFSKIRLQVNCSRQKGVHIGGDRVHVYCKRKIVLRKILSFFRVIFGGIIKPEPLNQELCINKLELLYNYSGCRSFNCWDLHFHIHVQ